MKSFFGAKNFLDFRKRNPEYLFLRCVPLNWTVLKKIHFLKKKSSLERWHSRYTQCTTVFVGVAGSIIAPAKVELLWLKIIIIKNAKLKVWSYLVCTRTFFFRILFGSIDELSSSSSSDSEESSSVVTLVSGPKQETMKKGIFMMLLYTACYGNFINLDRHQVGDKNWSYLTNFWIIQKSSIRCSCFYPP